MASAALVVSRREESKAGLSLKNGPREVGFPQDPENPPISRSHIPFKIVARAPPRQIRYKDHCIHHRFHAYAITTVCRYSIGQTACS